jgi:hypothetical protein
MVDTQSLWQEVCGPEPMVRRIEECVADRLMFRRTATALTEYILAFSVVEGQEDWRGVATTRIRWFTEADAQARAQRAGSAPTQEGETLGCDLAEESTTCATRMGS